MKIGDAVAAERQLWADIAQIPNPEVQDRYLAMAEQTESLQEAQAVLSGLAKVGPEISALIANRQNQLLAEKALSAEVITVTAPETEHQNTVKELICEPVETLAFAVPEGFGDAVSLIADDMFNNYKQIRADTQQKIKHLGQKKAERERGREAKSIERLFLRRAEGHSHRFVHFANDPTSFTYLAQALIDRTLDPERAPAEQDMYKELGRKFMNSGEQYVKEHADELRETSYYVPEMLTRYSEEIATKPDVRGPAGHLVRAYFSSANTPERAVACMNRVIDSFIDGYKNRLMQPTVGRGLMLYYADFFSSVPYIENLQAAANSYHKPRLVSDAYHLAQFMAAYYSDNYNLGDTTLERIVKQFNERRAEQTKIAVRTAIDVGSRTDPDFSAKKKAFENDRDLIEQTYNKTKDIGDRGVTLDQYMRLVNGVPGPAFKILFAEPMELSARYEEVIGNANLFGQP